MQGKATLWRHPIHPMLVPFPIAFFVGSFVADVVDLLGGSDFWTAMGTWLIAFGLVGGLLAALFGFIDYFTIPMGPEVRGTATRHMLVNLVVVALYAVNLYLRWRTPETPTGYVLSLIGVLGLAYSGWLGGALSYEHRLGTAPEQPTGQVPVGGRQRTPAR